MPRPDTVMRHLVKQLHRQLTTSFLPGEQVPSTRELAAAWGVGTMTVHRALRHLAREGVVAPRAHRGWIRRRDTTVAVPRQRSSRLRVGVISALGRAEWGQSPLYQLLATEALRQNVDIVEVPNPRLDRVTPARDRVDLSRVPWRLFDVGLLVDIEDAVTLSDGRLSRRPVLAVDRDATAYGLDSVIFDNAGAGRLAAQHLLELGHRRLAVTDEVSEPGWPSEQTWIARRHGFEAAAAYSGGCIRPEWRLEIPHKGPHSYRFNALRASIALWSALPRKRRPTALFCFEGSLVPMIAEELTARGLSVPRDISVVTVSGKTERPPSGGERTLVWLDTPALARRALGAAQDVAAAGHKKAAPGCRPQTHLTPLLLVPGKSTSAAPAR